MIRGATRLALRIPGYANGSTYSVPGEERKRYLYIRSSAQLNMKLRFYIEARKVYTNPKTNKDKVVSYKAY